MLFCLHFHFFFSTSIGFDLEMFRRNNGCHFLIIVILLCNRCGCGADDEALRLLLKGNELVGQDPPRHLEAIEAWRSFALCNVAFSSASAISHLAKTASMPQFCKLPHTQVSTIFKEVLPGTPTLPFTIPEQKTEQQRYFAQTPSCR